jgi:hypothetical protein
MKNAFILTILAYLQVWALTGEEVIKKYNLTDLSFDRSTFSDSLCPVLAESTFTWYSESTGLIDSQYNCVESFKCPDNYCRWKIYYNHKVFPHGARATREYTVDANTRDTATKVLSTYDKYGNLLESDNVFLRSNSRMISGFTYNGRGQRTAYYHINVGAKGGRDTSHIELTTYDKNGCPKELQYPLKNAKALYECNAFDTAAALIQIDSGKERPQWIWIYDKENRLKKLSEYSWVREGNPLIKTIFYIYDSQGRVKREYYLVSPDCMGRPYSGPGSFEITWFVEYTYDDKGREVTKVKYSQPCFGN